jgi:hypothetical protein
MCTGTPNWGQSYAKIVMRSRHSNTPPRQLVPCRTSMSMSERHKVSSNRAFSCVLMLCYKQGTTTLSHSLASLTSVATFHLVWHQFPRTPTTLPALPGRSATPLAPPEPSASPSTPPERPPSPPAPLRCPPSPQALNVLKEPRGGHRFHTILVYRLRSNCQRKW